MYTRVWQPTNEKPKAVLVFIHGAGEPSECFVDELRWLTDRSIAVVTGDLPGYGHSPGRRGHIRRFEEYIDIARMLIQLAEEQFPSLPLIIWGYSMGGLITLLYAARHGFGSSRIVGYVLFAPCVRLSMHISGWRRTVARVAGIVWPTYTERTSLTDEADPYRTNLATAGWFIQLNRAMSAVWREKEKVIALGKPMIVMQGLADTVVDAEAVLAYVESVPSATIVTYEATNHNLIGSEHSDRTMTDVHRFVSDVCGFEKS